MSTYKRGRGVFRLLCLLVCALALSSQVLAAGSGTLTLRYSYGNAKFQLYYVANASGNFTSEFTDCGVTLLGSGSSGSESGRICEPGKYFGNSERESFRWQRILLQLGRGVVSGDRQLCHAGQPDLHADSLPGVCR